MSTQILSVTVREYMSKADDTIFTIRYATHLKLLDFVPNGYVYLAYCAGFFKIGRSTRPYGRVKHFDTIMPVEVELVHTIPCDDYTEAERQLHEHYADFRVKGEWFDFSPIERDQIMAMERFANGRFQRSSLPWWGLLY
ncbi:MAG: GIY-YIG nuclease family protein [Ardenticatenaceae bacterium]|nr:GIY-YIG nuclease family protein [Ardenticatenaceae bacterium]